MLSGEKQEEEAEKLMADSLSKNFIDYEEYPQSADIQNRCVNMIGKLFHAPSGTSVGTSSVGSSEAGRCAARPRARAPTDPT